MKTKLAFTPNKVGAFSLKRKVGYDRENEDVDEASRQLQRMRVDSTE